MLCGKNMLRTRGALIAHPYALAPVLLALVLVLLAPASSWASDPPEGPVDLVLHHAGYGYYRLGEHFWIFLSCAGWSECDNTPCSLSLMGYQYNTGGT